MFLSRNRNDYYKKSSSKERLIIHVYILIYSKNIQCSGYTIARLNSINVLVILQQNTRPTQYIMCTYQINYYYTTEQWVVPSSYSIQQYRCILELVFLLLLQKKNCTSLEIGFMVIRCIVTFFLLKTQPWWKANVSNSKCTL